MRLLPTTEIEQHPYYGDIEIRWPPGTYEITDSVGNSVGGGQKDDETKDLPALSDPAAVAYEILLGLPPYRTLTGPELLTEMEKHSCQSDQSSLTSRIIPELKPYGVENAPRKGYRIPQSKRPKSSERPKS